MHKNILTLVGITILFLGACITPSVAIDNPIKPISNGNTLYVGGSGEGNYTKIQNAIDDASEGDTVFVYAYSSPYYESIEIYKTINLIGENRDTTEIISIGDIITLSTNFINISGFSIINYWGTSLYICSSNNNICYNNFSGFDYYEPEEHIGIKISNYNNYNLISNNNFYNLNETSIDISPNCIDTSIINNTFFDNQDDIIIRSFCHNTKIIGNKILGNYGSYNSIYIIESNNTIIKENYITPPDTWVGIRIYCSHNNIIDNNTIIGIKVSCGIHLWNSNHNIIYDNYMYNCGLIVINSFQNSVFNNTVNNKPLVYIEGYSDLIITNDSGQILLVNCDNISVQSQNLSYTYWGIALLETKNCFISDCIFSHIGRGISIDYSDNNVIINNCFSDSGIVIDNSQNNLIKDNNFTKKHVGVLFYRANYNIITNNSITYNSIGIDLNDGCSGNNISNNFISNQKWYGLEISPDSYDNIIYHNKFINNKYNAWDKGSNIWDNGYPSGGNFWDDYNGTDADGDGIGDTSYPIIGNKTEDRYPLGNFKPDNPEIDGPTKCKPLVDYNYTFVSTDSERDDVWYHLCWGDKEIIYIYGPYPSGEELTLSYNWTKKGTYTIACWVRDIYDAISDVSTLEVTVPRTRTIFNSFFLWFLERFPMLERLLSFVK